MRSDRQIRTKFEEGLKGLEAEFQAYSSPNALWVWVRGSCYFSGMVLMLASFGLFELDRRTAGHPIEIDLPFYIKILPLIAGFTLIVLTAMASALVKRARKKQQGH